MIILVTDDEPGVRNLLQNVLKKDHEIILCEDGALALAVLEKRKVDLVFTDHQMPNVGGIELIRRGKELSPSTFFLMMTGNGSAEQALEAVGAGAEDSFSKPFDLNEIKHHVNRIQELRLLQADQLIKKEIPLGRSHFTGTSDTVKSAKAFIEKVGPLPTTVLLLGSKGIGKKKMARAIHEIGPNCAGPFAVVSCESLGETELEQELFGREKNASQGTPLKLGKLELARGGTLFIEEISKMPSSIQSRLLPALEQKTFFRMSGRRLVKNEARVIVSSHNSLKEMVEKHTFRKDLFEQLNLFSFQMPVLKDRKDELAALVDTLWMELNAEFGKKIPLSSALKTSLCQYEYPGNITELKNVLEHLMILADAKGQLDLSDLPAKMAGNQPLERKAA